MSNNGTYAALDQYVHRLITESSPSHTIWNVEKLRQGVPTNWNYIDGCMMTALLSLYEITGERRYFDFVESFIDAFVNEDGSIRTYKSEGHALDDINEGRVLFALYAATGKEKYRKAADFLRAELDAQPRTVEGSWWHKQIYPNQVWLDGIYMAQPFAALYEKAFGAGDYSDILRQVGVVRQHMRDNKTGLYYHGYDASRSAFWCDQDTGLSQNFWLRAIGWFSVALIDLCEILPEQDSAPLKEVFSQLMRDLLPFADEETGMYFQVVDHPEAEGNYLETSGSSMIAYAMLKGARLGILEPCFAEQGQKTFDGIVRTNLSFTGEELNLNHICLVAGLGPEKDHRRDGSIAYYLSEPIVQNDAKGVAPLLMCYTEIKRR
ncbi:MAG: glycoside hydrolase family 88 protein [Clostridia bacterium]|nr:glycoside hydrolase family 88 protein [Clostridia bacterium]